MKINLAKIKELFRVESISILLMVLCVFWPFWFHSELLRASVFLILGAIAGLWLLTRDKTVVTKKMVALTVGTGVFSLLFRSPLPLVALMAGYTNQKTPRRKTFGYVFFWFSFAWLATVTMSQVGILENMDFQKYNELGEAVHRYTLGFSNPNSTALFLLPSIFSGYLLWGRKHPVVFSILSLGAIIPVYLLTECDTALIAVCLLVIFCVLQRRTKVVSKIVSLRRPQLLVIVFTLISIVVGVSFGANLPNDVNDALSNRPYLINLRIEDGSVLNVTGSADNYTQRANDGRVLYPLDNMYVGVLVYGGIIAYILFLMASTQIRNLSSDDEKLVMMLILLYGLAEQSMLLIVFMLFVISSQEQYSANRRISRV